MASKEDTSEQTPEDSIDAECQVVKLLLSDLHPDVTEQIIEGYFESRMVEVVSVSLPSERKCIVSVIKLKDVEKFCAKNHKIKKRPVKIELLPKEVNDPYTIEVAYPLDTFDEDLLEAYFTGPASGERKDDEDKSIEWIRIIEPGRCHIKFELSEDAACVLAKKGHMFMKKELIVSHVKSSLERVDLVTLPTNPSTDGMKPIEEGSSLDDKYERDKLIIRNIPEGVGNTYFDIFLGGALDSESEDWYTFELNKTRALLTFVIECSIEELNTFCEIISSRQMKGQVLVVELCRTNCTVLITGITEESFASRDDLKMYFGNKRSGGGRDQVEEVVMLGMKKAKVTFKSSKTVASVLSMDHSTLGPNVKMVACSPLDDDVGEENDEADDPPLSLPNTEKRKKLPSLFDTAENVAETKKRKKDPAAKRITLDLLIAKYLSNNRDILDGIAREVQATATVDWNNGIIELLLNNTDASPDELESAVTQFNSLVSSTVCRANIHFPPEASTEAFKTIANFSSKNNSGIDFTTKDNCVGIAGRVNQIRDLENTVHNLCERIVPASDQISLTREDFVYISRYAIKEATKAHPNVKIKMDGVMNVMYVSGSRHDVSRFKESYNDFTSHATVPVQVTKLAMEFLKGGKGAGILQTLIKRDSVIPFFSKDLFAGHSLSLLCPHTDAQQAENVSATISVTILEKNFNGFPQYFFTNVSGSPQFKNFKQKMSNKYVFLCAIERNRVFKLVCRKEIQQQLSDLFCKFVAEECSITERIQMKKGVWRLFNSSMENKWKRLEAEMRENGIEILSKSKPTASKPFLKIKGDRNTVAQLEEKFKELQKLIHELKFTVSRPGVVQHFYKDPHGRVTLQGVETVAKVCIELEVEGDITTSTISQSHHISFALPNDRRKSYIGRCELDMVNNKESEDDDFEHIGGMPMDEDVLSSISLDAAVTMCIYGESEQAVKRAEKKLRTIIDTLIVCEEVDDPNICELSSAALGDLKEFAHQQNVDIDIDNDPALHTIKILGCTNDVLKVKDKVRDALSHVHQFKAKKEVAATVSKHFKWVRQLSDGPEDYDEVFSLEIEQAYRQKKPYRHIGDVEKFAIDFSKMEETDLDNGDKVKVARVDFTEDEKPIKWVPMPKDLYGREATVHLVTLKTSDAEYKDALSKFDVTMKSSYNQTVSIQRIQNPVLYGQYMARKKEMEKRNPPKCQNERWLFHGTKPAVIDAINTQGLNRSFKSTTMYGQGVYFARDASYSHRYTQRDSFNHCHMYLAQVLTGEFAVGNRAMMVPPPKNNQQNRHILFDSTVDNTADPSIFVVYTDSQAYAAYLITYC